MPPDRGICLTVYTVQVQALAGEAPVLWLCQFFYLDEKVNQERPLKAHTHKIGDMVSQLGGGRRGAVHMHGAGVGIGRHQCVFLQCSRA